MSRLRFFLLYLPVWLILTIITVSCVREEEMDNTPENNFETLWRIIDEKYCFLDYKADTLGLDWNEVHSRYKARISPSMSSSQLFEVL